MRPAALLLLIEADALRPIIEGLSEEQFDAPTVCTGWSVRDVLGHCGAALTRVVADDLHSFSPAENEIDVERRRGWPIADVLDELFRGYEAAAVEIDMAGGRLDATGLGEWMHGGDVRDAVGAANPYASEGSELAFELLLERSAGGSDPTPRLEVTAGALSGRFGGEGAADGTLATDLETFVRLSGGRRPDPDRYRLRGADPGDLVLFT